VVGRKGWIDVATALIDPETPAPCASTLTNLHLEGGNYHYKYDEGLPVSLRQACPNLKMLRLH
jgi:hypothetical protein